MKRIKIPRIVKEFASIFHANQHSLYIVGGAVRNQLLGIPSYDYDFATDATPTQIMEIFPHVIPTGIDHGTVTILFKGEKYEVTTFRSESTYSDSRHPDSIEFASDIHEDLSRRDFTINALSIDTRSGKLIDHHQGILDLGKKRLRAIGDPYTRFSEDSLRILRGYRFIATLEFTFDEATKCAASELASTIVKVSTERIRDEFNKMLSAKRPSLGLLALQEQGVLQYIIPELSNCVGVGQKGMHKFDVFTHSVYTCDGAPRDNLIVRWAALLHDIGKPRALHTDKQGIITFHRHEIYSAELADTILKRLKFSNHDRYAILHLIEEHMFFYTPEWTDAAVRRFIARVGIDAIEDLFFLRRADSYGAIGAIPELAHEKEFCDRINRCIEEQDAFSLKDLKVNGRDLIKSGIPQGPLVGTILHELLETVLDDPTCNTEDKLTVIALGLKDKYS